MAATSTSRAPHGSSSTRGGLERAGLRAGMVVRAFGAIVGTVVMLATEGVTTAATRSCAPWRRLRHGVRDDDVVARLAGDEFAVVVADAAMYLDKGARRGEHDRVDVALAETRRRASD